MKTMQARRPLGSSGIAITTVGFGSWAIGGGGWSFGWGAQGAASIAAMRYTIELGVNWTDTAADLAEIKRAIESTRASSSTSKPLGKAAPPGR